MTSLQKIIFPGVDFNAPEELYIRIKDSGVIPVLKNRSLNFKYGGIVSFDTYFNFLAIKKWKTKCGIENVSLKLCGQGKFLVRIGVWSNPSANQWLQEEEVILSEEKEFSMDVTAWPYLDDGLLYVAVFALSDGTINSGEFYTKQKPRRSVKLGAVITHFNRKKWVVPAINRVRNQLLSDPKYSGKINLIVIDNSRNITVEEAKGVTVIQNENLGGTGGFARGLLYLEDSGCFTHCLFMDDDASCEIESLRRTYAWMQYAKNENAAIAGGMLIDSEPYRAHELGARFCNGTVINIGKGIDFRSVCGVYEATRHKEKIDYGAWWFFGFKLGQYKYYPFPFFVRGDDILFGIKNNFDIDFINGISVWAEDFSYKESPITKYLGARSTIALQMIVGIESDKDIRKIVDNWVDGALQTYLYASASAACMGIRDALKGADFFADNLRPENFMKELKEISIDESFSIFDIPKKIIYPKYKNRSKIWNLIRTVSGNGVFLPDRLIKKKVIFQEKGFSGVPVEVYRFEKVFYWSSKTEKGFFASLNRNKYKSIKKLKNTLLNKLLLDKKNLISDYQDGFFKYTTRSFWENLFSNK